jgi:hypothetical protein
MALRALGSNFSFIFCVKMERTKLFGAEGCLPRMICIMFGLFKSKKNTVHV